MCGLRRIVLPDWSTIQRYSLLHQRTFRTRSTEDCGKAQKELVYCSRGLAAKYASHGDTIVNRWKKMSREKPQECLLQVDPDLHPDQ
jgi:hypothetical protein